MATLREYFDADFSHTVIMARAIQLPVSDIGDVQAESRIHLDFSSKALFASFFLENKALSTTQVVELIDQIDALWSKGWPAPPNIKLPAGRLYPGELKINKSPFAVTSKFFGGPATRHDQLMFTGRIYIYFDLDFTPLRILVLVGFLRIILFSEKLSFKWNSFDKLVLAWAICGAVIYLIQWGTMKALIYKCGVLFDVIGLYWLFRININSWKDMQYAIRVFAICSIILAVFVGIEWATGNNPFVALGTVRTEVRKGRYRCQASFHVARPWWLARFPQREPRPSRSQRWQTRWCHGQRRHSP